MGWRLAEEVLDRLPATVDPGARLFLCVLAQLADDTTRQVIPQEDLAKKIARRTGLSSNGQRSAIRRLVKVGADPRVPIGVDKAGAPVFAVPGRALTYRVPNLPASGAAALVDAPTSEEGGLTDAPSSAAGASTSAAGASTSAAGASTSAPYASTKYGSSSDGALLDSPSPEAAVLRDRFGDAITLAEAEDAVAWLRRERPDLTNLAGLFRSKSYQVSEALDAASKEQRARRAVKRRYEIRCDVCSKAESECRAASPNNGHEFNPIAIVTPTTSRSVTERAS